jgi:hypothetical protein
MQKTPKAYPAGPYLLPHFNPGQGGVDYLGIRQVNLDLMAECIPGINNATRWIRPYSVMCWIYWKFHRLLLDKGIASPSAAEMNHFKEKVETMFLWGHQLAQLRGIPGFRAGPKEYRGEKACLSFKSWGRNAQNTSLQAGVQYGPSLSDRGGLSFLHHEEKNFYRVTKRGEALAQALDKRLCKRKSYESLIDLSSMYATAAEANDLFGAWKADSAGTEEREVFRETFFNEPAANESDALGSRSAIICLIQEILKKSRRPLKLEGIRKSMAYGRLAGGRRLDLSVELQQMAPKWMLLQVRQAQRLALESLMAWVENRLLNHGDRDARKLARAAVLDLRKKETSVFQKEKPADILAGWLGRLKSFDDYVDAVFKDEQRFCMFMLCQELEHLVKNEPDGICEPAFKLLLLCRRFCDWFSNDEELQKELSHGGAGRISLEFWAKSWDKNCNYPLIDLIALVLNNMVLSQHFAVATNRFDGGTQKLRIALEEEGLEALVGKPWRPYIAADRLGTLLSLMVDCDLIKRNGSNEDEEYLA